MTICAKCYYQFDSPAPCPECGDLKVVTAIDLVHRARVSDIALSAQLIFLVASLGLVRVVDFPVTIPTELFFYFAQYSKHRTPDIGAYVIFICYFFVFAFACATRFTPIREARVLLVLSSVFCVTMWYESCIRTARFNFWPSTISIGLAIALSAWTITRSFSPAKT